MNAKTVLLISLVLNAGLLGSVAFLTQQVPSQTRSPGGLPSRPDRELLRPAEKGSGPKFGPEFRVSLVESGKQAELLDLETGMRLVEPPFELFGNKAKACVNWIRSNGMDVSGSAAPGEPGCIISYYVALVPVPGAAWDNLRAQEVLTSAELDAVQNPKRLCFQANEDLQTFLFRTIEGTKGILRMSRASSKSGPSVQLDYRIALPEDGMAGQETASISR
jgi:hypothetical protein